MGCILPGDGKWGSLSVPLELHPGHPLELGEPVVRVRPPPGQVPELPLGHWRPPDTFSVHYMKGGGTIAGLMNRLGHSRGTQSLDYARYEVTDLANMESTAKKMGLILPPELKAKLAEPKTEKKEQMVIPRWWYDRDAGADGPLRYQERGTVGWSEKDPDVRRETNREYMRKLRKRRQTG